MPHAYEVRDKYFLLAKQKGYRARSAFKLLGIQQKFMLIRPGMKVVDLGAAPGSFVQILAERVGAQGRVFGIDLQEMTPLPFPYVKLVQGDIFEEDLLLTQLQEFGLKPGELDGVTSDLAPKTSGIKDIDTGLSADLTEQAFFLSTRLLKPGGFFVGKIFEGPDFQRVLRRIKTRFRQTHVFKPDACRDRSYETYIIGVGFKVPLKTV